MPEFLRTVESAQLQVKEFVELQNRGSRASRLFVLAPQTGPAPQAM
jgi:hypothetical protein